MNTPEENEVLIAAVTSAYRARDVDGKLRIHPNWHDLDDEGRREAFDASFQVRRLESALDDDGENSTIKAVIARIHAGR
jgi:hypothetical protein